MGGKVTKVDIGQQVGGLPRSSIDHVAINTPAMVHPFLSVQLNHIRPVEGMSVTSWLGGGRLIPASRILDVFSAFKLGNRESTYMQIVLYEEMYGNSLTF